MHPNKNARNSSVFQGDGGTRQGDASAGNLRIAAFLALGGLDGPIPLPRRGEVAPLETFLRSLSVLCGKIGLKRVWR